MCVPVCKCVSACARVCALGIPPPPPLSTGGCVRPSAWSARPRPEAARPRAHRERGDGLGPALLTGGRGGSAGAAAPRRPHTPAPPPGPQRNFGFWGSPVRVAAAGKEGSQRLHPRWGGSVPASRCPAPRTSRAEREVPREGDPAAGGVAAGGARKGALTSAGLIPAARGPARGSGPAAAVSEVAGARSSGRRPCRRGGRR